MNDNSEIEDFTFIVSSIGNAYFSGLTFDELWNCIVVSNTREELDAAISITIDLTQIKEKRK